VELDIETVDATDRPDGSPSVEGCSEPCASMFTLPAKIPLNEKSPLELVVVDRPPIHIG
jgi:hypothetical protein